MGTFFESFVMWFIGSPGRFILQFILDHQLLFLTIAFIYASLLLYSKWILLYYLPKQMRQFIQTEPFSSDDNVFHKWMAYKKMLPWYIVVPSKHELWIKQVKNAPSETKLLFFQKNSCINEREQLKQLLNIE
ncbi:hypothetical protein [Listeria fleischmannii]|uniref:Uncharacterized protein n=1 Tax=Listeria fleischmannii TaxID=1069827 RepID=A0A841YGK7_9LIST|nr:hypothetical protein [Listeria fleischmannii]MBC1399396.1 hypothetical protein [Listeria fleischmannii]MBC1418086.1 hypothetical protein [Listeria fleischmannii]MBC1427669.1 hypothetical protein [Listeria fleischmannii]